MSKLTCQPFYVCPRLRLRVQRLRCARRGWSGCGIDKCKLAVIIQNTDFSMARRLGYKIRSCSLQFGLKSCAPLLLFSGKPNPSLPVAPAHLPVRERQARAKEERLVVSLMWSPAQRRIRPTAPLAPKQTCCQCFALAPALRLTGQCKMLEQHHAECLARSVWFWPHCTTRARLSCVL